MPSDSLDSHALFKAALASLACPIPSPASAPASPPLCKHIPNTRFLVDSFRPPSPPSFTYFLSHFHSDHYAGLGPNWTHGLIFASSITSSLVINILKVPHQFVFPLPLREPKTIDNVEVTLVDANHCPGAVQFLFRITKNESYVHTGDFRFHTSMKEDEYLRQFIGCDAVFLDTTYCNPKYLFPSQEESVDYVSNVVKNAEEGNKVLFLVATYVIGKEKILLEVAKRCQKMIYVDAKKMEVLKILGYDEMGIFTMEEKKSDVHVVGWNVLGETWPYFRPNFNKMKEMVEEKGYSKAIGFVPTGWTYEVKRSKFSVRSKDSLDIHLVPYSEHSNFNELREFIKFLRPKKVIPTVGADVENDGSKETSKILKHFAGLVDETANKREFLMGFLRGSGKEETEDITTLNSSDKSIEELRDCLPMWVTEEHLLDLIKDASGNVVEAVSSFYEREMEIHGKVFPHGTSPSLPKFELTVVTPTVALKTEPELLHILKPPSGISPSKRKKSTSEKSVKKTKSCTKIASGSNQSTITKFFNKNPVSIPTGTPLLNVDDVKVFSCEVEQFISIIGGDELLIDYASEMLKNANGDVNKALNLHYTKHELGSDETLSIKQECSSQHERNKKMKIPTSVSLPPEQYNPVEHACWEIGTPAPYIHLARTFELVQTERGKLKAASMFCNMFRSLLVLSPEDVLPAVYLCTNSIAPDHRNVELNIGGSLVSSALEEACGTTRSKIREMYTSLGDLGDVAQLCRQSQKLLAPSPPLLINNVFSTFQKISEQTGSGSISRKKSLIVNLMRSCREMEIKFVVRSLVRNLRIGAMMRTILPALAQAAAFNFYQINPDDKPRNLKENLQSLSAAAADAYNIVPDLGIIVPSLVENGPSFSTLTLSIIPGIPVKPMLAKITNGVSGVLDILGNKAFTCEYKYDGQRAQVHRLSDGSIRIFSRNGDETTSRFPDVVNAINDFCHEAVSFIVDSEIVAVDRTKGNKIMSFQELSSRERGSKESTLTVDRIKVDVCVFVFDIMLANGETFIGLPLRERRKFLRNCFGEERLGYLEYAKEMTIEADEGKETKMMKLAGFLSDAIQSSCEGIMAKALDVDAAYRPSKRTDAWLKVKRDYVDGLNDSLDLVPIGAWHGNGRKAGWFSPFLVACYDPDTEEFQSVCRVMSGFSDEFYIQMKELFSGEMILAKKPPYYRTDEQANVWFAPAVVWAIRGADLSLSPVHHAALGLVHPSRGISLRFPRFLRSVPDRSPYHCSSPSDVADLFTSQTRKMILPD